MSIRRTALLLVVLLGAGLGRSAGARTVDRPYSEVEAVLLQRLHLQGKELGTKPVQVQVSSWDLFLCLDKSYCVTVTRYEAGRRLQLRMEERYDIGGIGGNALTIDVQRIDAVKTRIRAHYFDKAIGFFVIPFAYVNPGWVKEAHISACLAALEGPPREADRIAPQVARLPEAACERLQGRSCGPEGAVLPCDTASNQRLQCTCRGVLDCR